MSSQSQQQLFETQGCLPQYRPLADCYDEYADGDSRPRTHWAALDESIRRLDEPTWQRRKAQLDQLIEGNGITYNVYGHDQDGSPSWAVDMMPHLLAESEFTRLESALSQRARLLNLILEDFYGRQTILQEKRIDPFLILANPAFARPCHGILGNKENHLNIYAADVARSADGKWWVLSDRVEAVSGLGYAMDNRMLLSRIFPNLLQRVGARPLNAFFENFCRHIESLAKHNTHNPNIALLSPGPKNETYYEHSFLSRNLGFTLAEGADLTVRDNRLYMKTIGGTQQIDVLLRRVDSSWSDPLEMRNDSLLGVPGLVNTVRQGNLSIANALGSSLAETPAIPAFLPWLSRNLLSEQLEIPSVATWWCGQRSERQYVLENLDQLVVKPTFRTFDSGGYFGPSLSASERDQLKAAIERRPQYYCAQEILKTATTPVSLGNRMEPRPYLLRVFMIPDGMGGWSMMPGGFARCAPSPEDVGVSMQTGGSSKDVWVVPDTGLADEPHTKSYQIHRQETQLERRSFDLPSRTADNLFWLGRYIERAEMQGRLLRTTIHLLVGEEVPEIHRACRPFISQLNKHIPLSQAIMPDEQKFHLGQVENHLKCALNDRSNQGSLAANLGSIERIGESLKERFSVDSWKRIHTIQQLGERASELEVSIYDQFSIDFLDTALERLASLNGDISENMTRGQSWVFMQLGRRIERGLNTTHQLASFFDSTERLTETLLQHLLELSDCSITYRRRYLNTLNPLAVLDMTIFDSSNPRSLMFQAESIRDLLKKLPHSSSDRRNPVDTTATQLFSQIGITNPAQLSKTGSAEFFNSLAGLFSELSVLIETGYFAHTQASQPSKFSFPLS